MSAVRTEVYLAREQRRTPAMAPAVREARAEPAGPAMEADGSRVALNPEPRRRAASMAGRDGVTLEEQVERAAEERLAKRRGQASSKVTWPILPGGARPGVRIEDRDALYDIMEGRG